MSAEALRAHKVPLAVLALTVALGAFEARAPDALDAGDRPEWYLAERNIADVSEAVHPGRASTFYYRAYQKSLCAQRRADPACDALGPVDPAEVRALLERSLATGNESIELALYNYARVLVQTGAPAAEIDAAVRRWRRAHPHSQRPDPRDAGRPPTG